MEYLTGVRHKDTLEISELRKQAQPGQTVKVNGAVHAIRNMGTVAFVILRKREGLLQGVYEEGTAKFDLKDIKEAATIEVEGVLEENEKAPGGIGIDACFPGLPLQSGIYGDSYAKDWSQRRGRRREYLQTGIFPQACGSCPEPPVL